MEIIAHIRNDYREKFGIPRQSGMIDNKEKIVFEKKYESNNYIRGIECFNYIWLLWIFNQNEKKKNSATVRPPRLGGNKRMGVFATRSPFRPNNIGLSCVRLYGISKEKNDNYLIIGGSDLLDGTPIIDIKPYIPYSDCHVDATGGFSDSIFEKLDVDIEEEMLDKIEEKKKKALIQVLSQDPRPSYQNDEERIYGMKYGDKNIRFYVKEKKLKVISIEDLDLF